MYKSFNNIVIKSFLILVFLFSPVKSEIVKKIIVKGNDRISVETITMFSNISINDNLDQYDLNDSLKSLFKTNFFKDVSINLNNQVLLITVIENPIIEKIIFSGVKAKKIKKAITENLSLKSRSSFSRSLLQKDKELINTKLRIQPSHKFFK